ncbi:transcriptional regulator, TetR family [Methylomagnum ishizawai]|uniref:Transcriptional regulator, TetR family n=1 Tax=Methylomagnum ishizawai TaxID=1760988 RepID=A0A1Y6D2D1_9GAMM|nr:CerR family C-terminal domain-containing protein [Methylomagnum ishizawai]SMF97098.1 transcriptional regulator, TetR family [Methylomagnum ishizawai]
MNEPQDNEQTRDRLLQAALETFGERGFRDATVRDICARAGVNPASVNYYFGGKEALYRSVLALAFQEGDRRYPQDLAFDTSLSQEERLGFFIRALLLRLTDDSLLGSHGRLIAREIADPTPALDHIIDTILRPRIQNLREILPDLLGPGWRDPDIARCIFAIMGQCLVYQHSRSLVDRLYPEVIGSPEAIAETADFITRYTLAALRQLAAGSQT